MLTSNWKNRIKELRYLKAKIWPWFNKIDPQSCLYNGHLYDIESKQYGKVKIKQDRIAHVTKQYLFKDDCNIDAWIVVDNDYVSLVPAKLVKSGYHYRDEVLNIPDVRKVEKWFQNK